LKQGNFLYESKRLPLYSALLVPFNPDYYVFYGRIINNLIYFLSVFFFYQLISLKFKLNLKEKLIFTAIFAFNFIIFDNSFFILSDSLLLLLAVMFFYIFMPCCFLLCYFFFTLFIFSLFFLIFVVII